MDNHKIDQLIKTILEIGPVSPTTLRMLFLNWRCDPKDFTSRIMYGIEMGIYELDRDMFIALANKCKQ